VTLVARSGKDCRNILQAISAELKKLWPSEPSAPSVSPRFSCEAWDQIICKVGPASLAVALSMAPDETQDRVLVHIQEVARVNGDTAVNRTPPRAALSSSRGGVRATSGPSFLELPPAVPGMPVVAPPTAPGSMLSAVPLAAPSNRPASRSPSEEAKGSVEREGPVPPRGEAARVDPAVATVD